MTSVSLRRSVPRLDLCSPVRGKQWIGAGCIVSVWAEACGKPAFLPRPPDGSRKMPGRLEEDHANARFLAHSLAEIPGISIDPSRVQTNIVIFDVAATGLDALQFSAELKRRNVLANAVGPTRVRMVTHYDVTRSMCEEAMGAVREIHVDRRGSAANQV